MSQDRSEPPSGDYEVGYGRPPKHTQFKPGNAGRRKGAARKPKKVSPEEIVEHLLNRKFKARRGGKEVEVGIAELLGQRLAAIAMQGSPRELVQLLSFVERYAAAPVHADNELHIVNHQAPDSTVPLPPADLWKPIK